VCAAGGFATELFSIRALSKLKLRKGDKPPNRLMFQLMTGSFFMCLGVALLSLAYA